MINTWTNRSLPGECSALIEFGTDDLGKFSQWFDRELKLSSHALDFSESSVFRRRDSYLLASRAINKLSFRATLCWIQTPPRRQFPDKQRKLMNEEVTRFNDTRFIRSFSKNDSQCLSERRCAILGTFSLWSAIFRVDISTYHQTRRLFWSKVTNRPLWSKNTITLEIHVSNELSEEWWWWWVGLAYRLRWDFRLSF